MATYSFNSLYGPGTASINLTRSTKYTFTITNNSGSTYFTMETTRNNQGYYDATSPKNISGSFANLTNIQTAVSMSDYVIGFALKTGTCSFEFTPATNVTGSTLYLRGEGGITLNLV